MSEWRPIETAPTDGTPILARSRGYSHPFVVFWGAKCIECGPMPALPEGSSIQYSWLLSNACEPDDICVNPQEWAPLVDEQVTAETPTDRIDQAMDHVEQAMELLKDSDDLAEAAFYGRQFANKLMKKRRELSERDCETLPGGES